MDKVVITYISVSVEFLRKIVTSVQGYEQDNVHIWYVAFVASHNTFITSSSLHFVFRFSTIQIISTLLRL